MSGTRRADAATTARLALRGIAYRRATALIVLALAVVAATAAVVAPLYSRAAEQSIARGALQRSEVSARAVHVNVSSQAVSVAPPREQVLARMRAVLTSPAFGTAVTLRTTSSPVNPTAGPRRGGPVTVPLQERSGLCEHLPVTTGRCPAARDEIALTTRSAALLGLRLGDRLPGTSLPDAPDAAGGADLLVVGTFEPFDTSDDYWVGWPAFTYAPKSRPQGLSEIPPKTDVVYVGESTLSGRGQVSYELDVPVDPSRLDLVTAPRAARMVQALSAELGLRGVGVTSQLPFVVAESATRGGVVRVAAPLAAAQLVLLAWVILAHVVASATQERAPELGLAKLRGQTPARTVRFGLAEVVVLLLVAAPVGTVLGYLLVRLAASRLLEEGVPVQVTGWAVASVLVGVVGGAVSAVLAARGIARRHVSDLLRRVPGSGGGRRSGAVEGVVLALVVAGVAQLLLRRGSSQGPVAVAGPGMVALGAALLSARALRVLARRRTSRARERGRAGVLLGWAGVARRPGVARTTGVLTAAVCLLLVGVQAWQVASRERTARSVAETGASVVLQARAPSSAVLLDAVRAADPSGGYAMAVSVLEGGDTGGSALAVDAERADAVLGFGPGGPSGLAHTLRPALPSPLVLQPGEVDVELAVTDVQSPSPLVATLTVDVRGVWTELPLGSLRRGDLRYTATVPASCTAGCRLVGLAFTHPGTDIQGATATLSLTDVSPAAGGQALTTAFADPAAWRPGSPVVGGATVALTAGERLGVELSTPGGVPARVVHADSPEPLPGLVAVDADLRSGVFAAPGLDGRPQQVDAVRRTTFVPGLGRSAAVVDLGLATLAVPEPAAGRPQVWLSRDNPAAERTLRARLAAAGVSVGERTAAATEQAQLRRDGAVLALLLFLACGAVAVVVAAGAMLVAAFVGARQRAAESASLRLVGVPAGTVRTGLLVENLAGVGVALVAGAVGAAVAAWAVLPVLPLFDEASVMIDPRTTPDVGAGLLSLLAVAAGLGAVAAAVALTQGRSGAAAIREGTR